MHDIVVPKLNNNDESCVLQKWLAADGARVEADDLIAVLETSKATFDLVCEQPGVLLRLTEAGTECRFESVIGHLFAGDEDRRQFLERRATAASSPGAAPAAGGGLTITRGARELMDEAGVDEARLLTLGKTVIKRSDVEALIAAAGNGSSAPAHGGAEILELPRRQSAVARVVSLSHQTIPRAFVLVKVWADDLQEWLRDIVAREEDAMPGIPECVIQAVARLPERFPFFFGRLDDGGFAPARAAHVGVTMDIGKGLSIPVIRGAGEKTLREISDELMEMRVKAMRDSFKEEDLRGGSISLSINNDRDVLFALPIVLPTEVCMLSLGAVHEEPALGPDGGLRVRNSFQLGLAYDHRVINGFDAVQFLRAVKETLEAPGDRLVWS